MLVDPNAKITTLYGSVTESGNKYHLGKPLCRAVIPDAV